MPSESTVSTPQRRLKAAQQLDSELSPQEAASPKLGESEGEDRVLVFSYGSNSTAQLRARVENPALESLPA